MRYMDRKYGLGKTKNICGQKGGMVKKKHNYLLYNKQQTFLETKQEYIDEIMLCGIY